MGVADYAYAHWRAFQARIHNAGVRAAHPDIAFPPAALVHEVQGYVRLDQFLASGATNAAVIAALIEAHAAGAERPTLLEWGCGPGRILRPLSALMQADLHGCDPNPACVAAAKAYATAAAIQRSAFSPPAPYPAAMFDAVYGVSILTHMDAQAAGAWISEIARLLKPAGLAILTTHGARHIAPLSLQAREAFDRGDHVVLRGAAQGSRTFASYIPAAAMRALAADAGFVVLMHQENGRTEGIGQDIWVMRKT